MDRIGCCLILGAAVMICGGVPAVAEKPAKSLAIAIVGSGETGGGVALTEAKRALTESLRALGARVTGPLINDTGSSSKARQAVAPGRNAAPAPPVDVVIGLSAKPNRRTGAYTVHLAMSLRAVLHAVEGDGPPQIFNARRERRLPASCPKSCIGRIAARMAGEQAQALASGIFRQAIRMVSTIGRRLAFRGFSVRELSEIRQYLRVFPGFQRMGQGVRRAKDTVIGYRSRLDDPTLASALRKMLGHMGTRAGITRRGRAYTVVRVAGPAQPDATPRQW